MNESELNELVRDCFMSQKLSENSVERIIAKGKEARTNRRRLADWLPWAGVAAAAALIMAFAFQTARHHDLTRFAERVAGEIALRHNGTRPFDIEAHSFEEVQTGLKDLAFSVAPAVKHGVLSAYEILGARYCFLEGQQGVHLKVRNKANGALCTLYIASLNGPLEELRRTESEVHLAANDVKMWEDSDRLFALVE